MGGWAASSGSSSAPDVVARIFHRRWCGSADRLYICLEMPPKQFTHRDRQRLERAAEHYLRDCYRRRTAARVSEFADSLDLTQAYLSRVVALMTGMPVRDFLRERQLHYAASLLRATPLSVREIALASAFGTVSTFHRCFVTAFDLTPAAYRDHVMKCDSPQKLANASFATTMPCRTVGD
jgi:AraC-like DNA-binding protein